MFRSGAALVIENGMSEDSSRSRKKTLRERELSVVESGDAIKIHELARSTNDQVVLRAIARSESSSALTLKHLSLRNVKSIRKKVAENPNTPFKTLKELEKMGYVVPEPVLHKAARIELSLREGIPVDGIANYLLLEMLSDDEF